MSSISERLRKSASAMLFPEHHAAETMCEAADTIDELDTVLANGIDLLSGNLTGIEWRRATFAWITQARAVRAKVKGEAK